MRYPDPGRPGDDAAQRWTTLICSVVFGLALAIPADGQEPIPEPDTIFTGRIGGLPPGAPVALRWNGAILDEGTLQGDRYTLRAPLVSTPNDPDAPAPAHKAKVGNRPELLANNVRQGSVLIEERGAIFETTSFAARSSDPNPSATAVPLGQFTPIPPTPGPSPTTASTPRPTSTVARTATATAAGTTTATPVRTGTVTVTVTPTPPGSPTPTVTGTREAVRCAGDCDGNGAVSVDELIVGVHRALGSYATDLCPAFDTNGNGSVVVSELVEAVHNALNDCP